VLILLVDDSDQFASIYKRMLDRSGYPTEVAASGEAALDAVALLKPDLVIVDLDLPDMDGIEFTRRARAIGYEGPFIEASGWLEQYKNGLSEANFAAELQKPFRLDDLVQAVIRIGLLPAEPS